MAKNANLGLWSRLLNDLENGAYRVIGNLFVALIAFLAAAYIFLQAVGLLVSALKALESVAGIVGLMIICSVVSIVVGFYLGKRTP